MLRAELTTPERMKALVLKKGLDRVPVNPFAGLYAANVANISLKEYFLYPQKAFEAQMLTIRKFQYDAGPSYGVPEWVHWDFGGEIEFPTEPRMSLPKVKKRLIQKEEDIYNLHLPDPLTAPATSRSIQFARICRENGFGVSVKGGSMLELMQQLMGTDLLLKWMLKKPKAIHELYRKITDYIILIAEYYVKEFGAENVSIMNTYQLDNNTIISTKTFEKFSLPYIIELHKKCLALGIKKWIVHLCGDHTKSLTYWKNDIPLAPRTTFTVGSEMNIKETAEYMGDNYIIAGNVSNVILQCGTSEEVYEEAKKIVLKMKYSPGGFILMPDCGLSPLTPPENLYAMIKATKDFGKY